MSSAAFYARDGMARATHTPGPNQWPELDLGILRDGRAPPPTLPLDLFGGEWKAWITAAAEGASAPPDYVVSALLPAAATLIGTTRRVSPWPDWQEPSILWCAAVGAPSSAKSPAADPVLRALRTVERGMGADVPHLHAQWQARQELATVLKERWKSEVKDAAGLPAPPPLPPEGMDPGPEPRPPRVIISDTTPEALADILAGNPRGLLTTRDELAGWLESFNRYSGGSSRGMWIEAFGARPYTIDRVKSGNTSIPALSVCIHGTTQPDRLVDLLRDADDGLASRFLWAWPDPIPPRRPTGRTDHAMVERAFGRLLTLAPDGDHPVIVPVDTMGCDAIDQFRTQTFRDGQAASGLMASAIGKAPGLVLRLALILEHLWWAVTDDPEPPPSVSARSIRAAAALWVSFFRPMAARVYGDTELPQADRDAALLARAIRAKRATTINLRDIHRKWGLPGLRKADPLKDAVQVLIEAGAIYPAPAREGGGSGRQRSDYLVNPSLLEVCDDE